MKKRNNLLMMLAGLCVFSCPVQVKAQTVPVDADFDIGTGFYNTNSELVYSIVLQPDGKIIAGGSISKFNGHDIGGIIRLLPNGGVDNNFYTNVQDGFEIEGGKGSSPGQVEALSLQADGKIIVGGMFTKYQGKDVSAALVRLNSDGTIDAAFQNKSRKGFTGKKGTGSITALLVQKDGRIIAGGHFNDFNGTTVENIIRLNSDGSMDGSFKTEMDGTPSAFALQPDGKIIVAGDFNTVNGKQAVGIARLNPTDGSLDNSFNANAGFDGAVKALALQDDGKIVVVGTFQHYNGVARGGIVRISPDGSIDNSFDPGTGTNEYPMSVALQPDGKIIFGGNFTKFNGKDFRSIVRLRADGSIDDSFDPGDGFRFGASSNGQLWQLHFQPNGKLIVAGVFSDYDNTFKYNSIIRLNAFTPALQIDTLSPATNYCGGTEVNVTYKTGVGSFNTNNVFTAQLSDVNGDFSTPVAIGTLAGNISGTIKATIPTATAAGSGYRIRVVSSNPVLTGFDNGRDITIMSAAAVSTINIHASKNELCLGDTVTLNASGSTGTSYNWDNNVTNNKPFAPLQTATYTVTATGGNGCTNSKQIKITVHQLPIVVANASPDTICSGGQVTLFGSGANTYIWNNGVVDNVPFNIDSTRTYTVTGTDEHNCQNTDQVTVMVNQPSIVTINDTICSGSTYTLGTQLIQKSGTYTEIFPGADINGCDSTVTLNLMVAPWNMTVKQAGRTLTAEAADATYQWIDCSDQSKIVGANNQSFTPNIDGDFAVIITQGNCSDTSDCFTVGEGAGIGQTHMQSRIHLYPNPVQDYLMIKGAYLSKLSIKDISGRTLYVGQFKGGRTEYKIDTKAWTSGIYTIHLISGGESVVYKVLKQ